VYPALSVALRGGADVDEKDGAWQLCVVELVVGLFRRQTLQRRPSFGKDGFDPC